MDHVFKRPDGESARSLSTIIFFGRSSEDMHAIELIKQSSHVTHCQSQRSGVDKILVGSSSLYWSSVKDIVVDIVVEPSNCHVALACLAITLSCD